MGKPVPKDNDVPRGTDAGFPPYLILEGVKKKIRTDPLLQAAEAVDGRNYGHRGEIVVCNLPPILQQWEILLHEIIHDALDGVLDPLMASQDAESVVTVLSQRLFGMLRTNRVCFAMLSASPPKNETDNNCECGRK